MKKSIVITKTINALRNLLLLGSIAMAGTVGATDFPPILDAFEDAGSTSVETPRFVITDAELGGNSTATQVYQDGVMRMEGTIEPARGQPGFVSFVMLLGPQGQPQDLSGYEGIEMRIRLLKGTLNVLAASSEIQNFDFHAKTITRSKEFQVVRIPFKSLKRVWSEPTALNLQTITSINLVASGMQAGGFVFEIDSVGFYKD
ncbi:hypothetical protein G0Q06_13165 [Puniceicoccales bacterium CK1056]|uniref:NADH:ubiquinone oxidoreductase intermediate-associated protein 30 domain-containing protein n=1 Tax=Oceanipulchritudo coccoides TaxID=2706888 RepID=A0A6B2M5F9_9BACT|nr:CIA30 family protein [Oceanipulchritudo coccoides]NDV63409.1 hypothetical protein [Oceanipulchritudo coccoides]